jgi:hypothetical protein
MALLVSVSAGDDEGVRTGDPQRPTAGNKRTGVEIGGGLTLPRRRTAQEHGSRGADRLGQIWRTLARACPNRFVP